MKLLLDTHIFLEIILGQNQSQQAKDGGAEHFTSTVSYCDIAPKCLPVYQSCDVGQKPANYAKWYIIQLLKYNEIQWLRQFDFYNFCSLL